MNNGELANSTTFHLE